ncbi:unnamed protein product, partial [marine sediment metagenome]
VIQDNDILATLGEVDGGRQPDRARPHHHDRVLRWRRRRAVLIRVTAVTELDHGSGTHSFPPIFGEIRLRYSVRRISLMCNYIDRAHLSRQHRCVVP